jgi:hypothetical protein
LPFRRRLLALVAAAVALLAWITTTTAVLADSSSDAQLAADANASRSNNGLRAYAVASDLTSLANRWAARMAAERTLEHNGAMGSEVCCWTALGENVGVGSSAAQVHRAFMASAEHRDNILSAAYTQVGIGTARGSDGRLYVDELFRRPSGATGSSYVPRPARIYTHRASRSAARVALHRAYRPTATAMIAERIARWRGKILRYHAPDPVGATFTYARMIASITLSPTRR